MTEEFKPEQPKEDHGSGEDVHETMRHLIAEEKFLDAAHYGARQGLIVSDSDVVDLLQKIGDRMDELTSAQRHAHETGDEVGVVRCQKQIDRLEQEFDRIIAWRVGDLDQKM
ncbi:MAG: hypothetical protein KGI50_01385 [Patescibacteria group bacterium]|nr:hypothetical protein [Patescibacteria group bacterium]MDE2437999.1 hypothetical protein [Patescibacteria group bacterium]